MTILCLARPAPAWDRLRFNLSTGTVEVPPDSPVGLSAFGEGTWVLAPADRAALESGIRDQGSGIRDRGSGTDEIHSQAPEFSRVPSGRQGSTPGPPAGSSSALEGDQPATHITAVALEAGEAGAAEGALREALARGADRAILVTGAEDADAAVTATVLAAIIRRQPESAPIDLVLLGATAPSGAPDEIGPMLADELGWDQVTAALAIDPAPDGGPMLHVEQSWVSGLRTVVAGLPAVVSVLPNPARPARYPAPAAALAAYRVAPIETQPLAGLPGVAIAPRVQVRRAALGEAPPVERLAGPLEESVAVLGQALRRDGR